MDLRIWIEWKSESESVAENKTNRFECVCSNFLPENHSICVHMYCYTLYFSMMLNPIFDCLKLETCMYTLHNVHFTHRYSRFQDSISIIIIHAWGDMFLNSTDILTLIFDVSNMFCWNEKLKFKAIKNEMIWNDVEPKSSWCHSISEFHHFIVLANQFEILRVDHRDFLGILLKCTHECMALTCSIIMLRSKWTSSE